MIAMDAAASERKGDYDDLLPKRARKEVISSTTDGLKSKTSEQMVDFWEKLCSQYPIISLEDALDGGRLGRLEASDRNTLGQESPALWATISS